MKSYLRLLYLAVQGDRLGAAILFYTCLPWPPAWPVRFPGMVRWITLVGLMLAALLSLILALLAGLGFARPVQAGLGVMAWMALTGGLHLDGVGDSGDGWAVTDPQRRLTVMQDSYTGAYGVMAIAGVLILKTVALMALPKDLIFQTWALALACGGGRWGQLWAIGAYPYLRPEGKGSIHHQTASPFIERLWGTGLLIGSLAIVSPYVGLTWTEILGTLALTLAIAWGIGYLFARRFGGHTGDTYGAVVEWSESIILCLVPVFGSLI